MPYPVQRWLTRVWPILAFLLLVGTLEAAHLGPKRDALSKLDPLAMTYGLSMLLVAAVGLGLVIGNVRRGLLLVAVAWTFLCGASIAKRRYLGAPFYPWDVLRAREVWGIWDQMPNGLKAAGVTATIALATALLACIASFLRVRPDPASRLRRAVVGTAILTALFLPFHPTVRSRFPGPGNALAVALQLRNVRWWPEDNYRVNGFTAGFLISLDVLQIPRPPATPWELPADCAPTSSPAGPVSAVDGAPPPDVVVLLLESLFDPLVLGVPLSRDPIPFLRTMMQESDAELHSTLWAHGTANAEFEILTGLSTAFLPPDSVVFFHYLHAPLLSLASEFRRAGYQAEAIHPNAGWFYARADAYRWLGFDRAWFQEDFIPPRDARSRLSDDRLFFAQLRQRLTDAEGVPPRPRFLWGVSLGTHGPYASKRVSHCDLRVGDDVTDAEPEARARFETLRIYSCLLERLDRRLQEFTTWLDARGRPYVLFAYGDHWPPLGQDVDPYREASVPDARLDSLRVSPTPLLFRSNGNAVLPHGYRGGFNFLGPAILRAAGVAPRCQFQLVEPLRARVDLIHAGLLLPGIESSLATEVDRYWALTYRLLIEDRP